ncbi:hypothetical protein GBAR_LOCUS5720 [Geodia barretti]|uniref:Calx-beta domain-containing protein n=1 Tax=Geodia barretti TaxID=519541 RepID=A0AA35RDH0_GEOBA|nr:hypothetical protein GBAR_LOCUS5720 [Geodia barretti]
MLRRDTVDGINIEPSEASVGIYDSDVAYVRIVGGSRDLPVNEGDGYARLFLAVTDEFGSMTCRVQFDFTVAVYTEAGTATINIDYDHISRNIQFSTDLSVLVKIRIIDDDTVDRYREETFQVILQNTPGVTQRIKPVRTPVTVVIRDNDVATFGLERASCKVDEAVTLTVCVVFRGMERDCPVEFPFDLRLEARAVTTTSADHDPNVTDITIGECSRSECTNITVYDDSSLELDETFYISLLKLPNHDGRIRLDIVKKTVTIEDNDHISIIFKDPAISVEGFPIQVCLLIEGSPRSDCPSLVAIQVRLRTQDGTATSRGSRRDYVAVSRTLTIPVCAKEFRYNISTIDDGTVENHEYFNVTLTHGSNRDLNERINIPTPTKRYEILDDDMAVVEISAPTNVLENARILRVCLNVRMLGNRRFCPVAFEFTVYIVKEDVTTDAADYDKSRVDVTFRPCDARECVDVPIIDDCSLERDENFTISLEPEVGLTNRIITNDSLTVTIENDDNTFIEMEHAVYKVFENATQIDVCAVIRPAGCKPSIDFPVRIFTVPDSAEATGLSADFVSAETNLIFSSSVNKACITIDILDNIQVEHLEESFYVTLERLPNTPDGVMLRRDEAEVIIVDDDKAELGFVMLAYTVNEEDDDKVEICVDVKSPDTIECPVVYPLEFIVTVNDNTTTKGEDYVDPGYDEDDPFRYDACARENCFTIDILNDNKVEDMTEQFDVTLEFSGGGGTAVTFQQDTATVTIIDEDVAMVSFTKTLYIVDEGVDSGKVRVCAEVVPPVDFDFSVNFTTKEEGSTAVVDEDYTATKATLQFSAGSDEECIDVPILDDCILEELEFIKLELGNIDNNGPEDKKSRVKTDGGDSKVKITDEQTIYVSLDGPRIVREDAGTVQICVIIQDDDERRPCSRDTDFDITFFTVFDSADGEDFVAVDSRQLTFQAFHNRVCTSVTINDDEMLEQTESFKAKINITHPHSHIALGTSSVEISIVNDDGE